MLKRKRLRLIPIIVAMLAVTCVFSVPSALLGATQYGVVLAAEEEETSLSSASLKDKPVGTYAIINGKVVSIEDGMALGKAEDIEGPVVLCGRGDDYYNHGEIYATCIDGELVILKAEMRHKTRHENGDLLKELEAAGYTVNDHAKNLIPGKQGTSKRTEYVGYAQANLYYYDTLQTMVQSTLEYQDDGVEVEGIDYACPYGHLGTYTLDDYDCSWYPGPDDWVWSYHRCEFSDGFDHASAARFLAWPGGDWEYRGYVYPDPSYPYWELITGDRW